MQSRIKKILTLAPNQIRKIIKRNSGVYEHVRKIEDLYLKQKESPNFLNANSDYSKTLNKISFAVYKSMMVEYEKSVKAFVESEEHKGTLEGLMFDHGFELEDSLEDTSFTLKRNSGLFEFRLKIKALELSDRNIIVQKLNDYLVIFLFYLVIIKNLNIFFNNEV